MNLVQQNFTQEFDSAMDCSNDVLMLTTGAYLLHADFTLQSECE